MNDTGKSLGSRLQHEIFYYMVRLRLVFLAKILLRLVVFYYTLLPSVRKRCYAYLAHRFPLDKGFTRWLHCYKLYICFAEVLLERSIGGILNIKTTTANSNAREFIKNNLHPDKGCMILTAHIGAWQLGLSAIEELNRPINIVQWINEQDTDKHYFEHEEQQGKHKIKLINSRDGLKASFAITSALQRKEIVCIAGDRVDEFGDQKVQVKFLGNDIYLPTTAFLLASITQVPLIVSFSILQKNGVNGVKTERFDLPPNLRRNAEALQIYVQKFATAMEHMVQEYPYHFFNFFDMWSHDDSSRM